MKPIKIFLSILLILSATSVSIFAQDFRVVHEGVEYAEVTKEISGLKVNMNLLRLDLTKVRLDVVHAMDEAIGVEKTSSIATRHGALAAINAGFFRLDSSIFVGDAAGVLMIDGLLFSESTNNRIALLIANSGASTEVEMRQLPDFVISVGKRNFHDLGDFSGINRERKKGEFILYTPEFHRTTLTGPGGVEIVVQKGKVTAIYKTGNTKIPSDGLVLSADDAMDNAMLKKFRIGMKVKVLFDYYGTGGGVGGKAEDIVGGVPQLIRDGKIDITWEKEKSSKSFVETRHPRTAVAKLKDGKFLMITVDGRSESSGGIGLQDLAEYLLSIGAVDAMNLDGGGSTTMFLDGKVVNHPSDKEGERKVSDALIVRKR